MMESAIRLCYSAAPLRLSYGSKGSENARASTFQLRFNNANLCLPQFSISHPVAHSFRHANCMLNKFLAPSKNEGRDNKILRGVTGASLVLACVLGLFNFCGKMNPKFDTAYAAMSSHNDKQLRPDAGGGEVALESLLKLVKAEAAEDSITSFHQEPNETEIDALKLYAIHLSKSGKKDDARNILVKEYSKWKDASHGHDLGMALVELLIFQGNYEEARKRLEDQIDQQYLPEGQNPKRLKYEEKIKILVDRYEDDQSFKLEKRSIAKILLYKAIVHTMLKQKEAAKCWEAFTKILLTEIERRMWA